VAAAGAALQSMLELKFYFVSALVMAAIWALPAAGVSLVYAVLRYPNFAIAEFMTLGAYFSIALLGLPDVAFWLAAALAAVLSGTIAAAVDQGIFRMVRRAGILPPILLSLGLMLVLQNMIRYFWGNQVRQFDLPLVRPLEIGGFIVTPLQAASISLALAALVGLQGLLRYTAFGRDVRAVANNPELALATGVAPERVYAGVLFTAGALAGLGGVLLGLEGAITPLLGWHSLIPIFAVAIMGGLGNLLGAALAALVLGLASEYSLLFLSSSYKGGLAFLALALVLLLRPQGILRGER
jgi:branched-chain amino acid transport system permease protein/neutral amino acid transport system permease protein